MSPRQQLPVGFLSCLLLSWACPGPAATAAALATGDLGTALTGVCGGVALLIAAWLTSGGVLVVLARVPGALGRAAEALSRRCLPAALRAAFVAALAVGASAGPALVGVAAADTQRPSTTRQQPPDLDRPGGPADVAPAHRIEPHPAASTPPPVPAADTPPVVVRPGDSLWRIASRSLGPSASARQIAAAWPQWWSANREVVGDDPDVIQPGQHLSAPTG